MTFEQQLFALLEQHDLSSLSITVYRGKAGRTPWLGASAQGDNKAAFDALVSCQDASAAIGSAIGELNVKRCPPVVAVDQVQPLEMAA